MFARLWERSLFGNLRASERLALSSLHVLMYICSYRGEEEILWQSAERQDASPHNVLSVLTEVVWATDALYEYVNREHLNLEFAEMTSSFLSSL